MVQTIDRDDRDDVLLREALACLLQQVLELLPHFANVGVMQTQPAKPAAPKFPHHIQKKFFGLRPAEPVPLVGQEREIPCDYKIVGGLEPDLKEGGLSGARRTEKRNVSLIGGADRLEEPLFRCDFRWTKA